MLAEERNGAEASYLADEKYDFFITLLIIIVATTERPTHLCVGTHRHRGDPAPERPVHCSKLQAADCSLP